MPSMPSLIDTLRRDYPAIQFEEATEFAWSPSTATISYTSTLPHAPALLLHELAHAMLEHHAYRRDVELLTMEAAAWEHAKTQAPSYKVTVSEDIIQDHLDTYREWLHARSRCPQCDANGYQTAPQQYQCPACTHRWKVNEARLCALRRYSTAS